MPVPSGSQHQAHLAQPGANLFPWLPGLAEEGEVRRKKGGKESRNYKDSVRFSNERQKVRKKAESSIPDSSQQQGTCSGNRKNGKPLCVYECV